MRKRVGWVWIVGICGFSAAAAAQSPSPPTATTQFDGIYAFVSGTNVNKTFVSIATEHIFRCNKLRRGGALVIANGQARYSGALRNFEGTVGLEGELTMRAPPEPSGRCAGCSPGTERMMVGRVESNGTVHARQTRSHCSWDLTWNKLSK